MYMDAFCMSIYMYMHALCMFVLVYVEPCLIFPYNSKVSFHVTSSVEVVETTSFTVGSSFTSARHMNGVFLPSDRMSSVTFTLLTPKETNKWLRMNYLGMLIRLGMFLCIYIPFLPLFATFPLITVNKETSRMGKD